MIKYEYSQDEDQSFLLLKEFVDDKRKGGFSEASFDQTAKTGVYKDEACSVGCQ